MKNLFSKIWHIGCSLLAIISIFSLVSCIGGGSAGSTNVTSGTKNLVSLKVSAQPSVIAVGSSSQFTATAFYSDNTSKNVTSSSVWSSSNNAIATINASGVAQSISEGQVQITASYQDSYGSIIESGILTVSNLQISSLAITPASVTVPVGVYQRLALIGKLADGTTVDLSVDPNTTWSTADHTIATIIESQSSGIVLAMGNASAITNINATYKTPSGAIYNAVVPVNVNNATIESIAIIGDSSITSGESAIYIAKAKFTDGNSYSLNGLKEINWSSSDPSVTSVGVHSGIAWGGSESNTGHKVDLKVTYTDHNHNFKESTTSVTLLAQGNSWSGEINTGFKTSNGFSIAVDSNDNPILFFSDAGLSNKPTVVKYNGSQWVPLTAEGNGQVSTDGSSSPSMVVDHLGIYDIVYIFYVDYKENNHITVQKLDTRSPVWTILQRGYQNGDSGASMSSLTSALDKSHTPYVGFHENRGNPQLAVAYWNGSSFSHYGKSDYINDIDASAASSLGLGINLATDVYLGFTNRNSQINISSNSGGSDSKWSSYSLAGSSKFSSIAGFYTESRVYATYQQLDSGGSLIYLKLANNDKSTLGYFTLNTNSLAAQNNLALGEQDTDKPVITYIDENGNVEARYYDPSTHFINCLGANPIAMRISNQFSHPKMVIGKNIAWVAYQDISGQIFVRKLDNPFGK